MNLKKIFTRNKETQEHTIVADTWKVTWTRRYGMFSSDTTKECNFFIDKDEAIAFKEALEDAIALLKHTGNETIVYLEKNND